MQVRGLRCRERQGRESIPLMLLSRALPEGWCGSLGSIGAGQISRTAKCVLIRTERSVPLELIKREVSDALETLDKGEGLTCISGPEAIQI